MEIIGRQVDQLWLNVSVLDAHNVIQLILSTERKLNLIIAIYALKIFAGDAINN